MADYLFLDDTRGSPIDDYEPKRGDQVLVAIANPIGRADVVRRLTDIGANMGAFIASNAHLYSDTVRLTCSIAMPFSLVSVGVGMGEHCIINTHSSIGHDCKIGDYVTMASHVALGGNVSVGDRVEFGTGAIVIPGISIGADAFIGAGAVVVANVPPGARVFGNPARKIA